MKLIKYILVLFWILSFVFMLQVVVLAEGSTSDINRQSIPTESLELVDFISKYPDANIAFEQAISSASDIITKAKSSKNTIRVVINLENNKIYKVSRPISIANVDNVEINGHNSEIINSTFQTTFHIQSCNHLTIKDLYVDYNPLPYTQGVITAFDKTAQQIDVKVDKGYPSNKEFATTIQSGLFNVMDRNTKAEKPGARDITPKSVENIGEGLLRVNLMWSANDCGPGQIPINIGDVVAIRTSYADAIDVKDSENISFINFNLYSSPAMGILVTNGRGGIVLKNVNIIPGPKPLGAEFERLVSTNSDGTHYIAVEQGPVIENCNFANTSDDAINVHNFYFFIVEKVGNKRYYVSPKWNIGLQTKDTIETYEKSSFESLGETKIISLTKKIIPELKNKISQLWNGKSPTTLPDTIYEIELQDDIPLKFGDAITSLSRIGNGTIVRNCTFHMSGRVMVKSPNSIIENNKFSYSPGVAIFAGSDIGYWAESNFAKNLIIRNNTFTHCILGAANMFDDSNAIGTIFVSMTPPQAVTGFQYNLENQDIVIENNKIDDSFLYGIFISNADHVKIKNNIIGSTFIRRQAFGAGQLYNIHPNSGILIGMSKNIEITDNTVTKGVITNKVVTFDKSCDKDTITLQNNILH